MAIAFIQNPEVLSEHQHADTAQLRALPGSSETRGFLLDDTVHVVDLWTYPRTGMDDITAVSSVRSFRPDGLELDGWTVLGSSQFYSRNTKGLYTQADIQPRGAVGRTNISWLRIPRDIGETGLFTQPHAMPRQLEHTSLSPEFLESLRDTAPQVGHLALIQ